jgi:hypothetical protein
MRHFGLVAPMLILIVIALASPVSGYSRIIRVELTLSSEAKIYGDVSVWADIYTGNNVIEYVHNVSATLTLPDGARLTSEGNPIFVGEMGPGPAHATTGWTVTFEEPGEYTLMVNASCVDTQHLHQWMNASATIWVYAPPHVEFEHAPMTNVHVDVSVIFNASKSYARGLNSTLSTYAWDFGDQTNLTTNEPVVEHKFTKIGNFTVSLTVTDSKGLSNVNTSQISVSLLGDLNDDGKVSIEDIAILAIAFRSGPGDQRWNEKCDMNHDEIIDIIDISIVATQYGNTI